jgi:hypothetical protein
MRRFLRTSSQDFQMRVEYAVTYTPFEPNGHIDMTPPFTLCGNNQMALRFRYTWRKTYQEYVYTEPASELWPYMYLQGVNPNPLLVPASQTGSPVVKMVDAGLISGQVNTSGSRQVLFRGRTSGFFGTRCSTATANECLDRNPVRTPADDLSRSRVTGSIDMPTRPWLAGCLRNRSTVTGWMPANALMPVLSSRIASADQRPIRSFWLRRLRSRRSQRTAGSEPKASTAR